ncbi:hypothetical protein V1281_003633 [Nitrobacteraceae bacterium AZCC 2161]
MSQISSGILGLMAAATTLGAIQYASGSDLRGTVGRGTMGDESRVDVSDVSAVNRAAKADRGPLASVQNDQRQTLSFRVYGLPDTSVLMRLPVARLKVEAIKNGSTPPSISKPVDRRSAIACEPPVSVLTEVAKLLQPGRCIT